MIIYPMAMMKKMGRVRGKNDWGGRWILCVMVLLCVVAQISSQAVDESNAQLTNPSQQSIQQDLLSVGDQLPSNCFQKCEILDFSNCNICYRQCSYSNGTVIEMKTCQYKYCNWWDIFPYSSDNPTSTYTRCTDWQFELLPQQSCIATCCGSNPGYTYFTPSTMQQCVDTNAADSQSNSTVIAIVASCLSALFLLIISLVIFCWCRHHVIVCFKNFLYFFENLCPCTRQERSNKKQSNEPSTDHTRSVSTLARSKRKWQPLKKKVEVTDLPTSKYMIKTQYDINPQIYCSVCLDDKLNCQTDCEHRYHFQCLRTSLTKKKKCPQCSSKNFNPLKIICQFCQEKYTNYKINRKNIDEQRPDFYHDGKIYCEDCLEIHLNRGRRQYQRSI